MQTRKELAGMEREWGHHVLLKAQPHSEVAENVARLVIDKQYVDPLCHALLYDPKSKNRLIQLDGGKNKKV